MRIVILGAGSLSVATVRLMVEHGHEVVIIKPDQAVVERLSEELDCGFVVGDGSRPAVLKEVGPKNTDFLFCLAHDDQDNIIAAQVGRTLGFGRVVASLKDPDFEPICAELGLEDVVFFDRAIARDLGDMVEGVERAGLTAAVRGGLRFLTFRVMKETEGSISALGLPTKSLAIAVTRNGKSVIVRPDTKLKDGDELLIVADFNQIDALKEIFVPRKKDE